MPWLGTIRLRSLILRAFASYGQRRECRGSVTMTTIPVCTNTDDIKKWHRKDMLANSGDGIFRMGETHYFGRASKPRCSCGILHALHVADFTPCARSGTGGMLLPAEDQPQTPWQLAIAPTSAA